MFEGESKSLSCSFFLSLYNTPIVTLKRSHQIQIQIFRTKPARFSPHFWSTSAPSRSPALESPYRGSRGLVPPLSLVPAVIGPHFRLTARPGSLMAAGQSFFPLLTHSLPNSSSTRLVFTYLLTSMATAHLGNTPITVRLWQMIRPQMAVRLPQHLNFGFMAPFLSCKFRLCANPRGMVAFILRGLGGSGVDFHNYSSTLSYDKNALLPKLNPFPIARRMSSYTPIHDFSTSQPSSY